jgi:hypothetical protein
VGSGKTRILTGIFELYGIPPRIAKADCAQKGEGDFWVALEGGGLFCLDNADNRINWLPDALAAASTGGSFEKKQLYTDSDRVSLKARSWICISSANPTFAADAGLADRLLVVRVERRHGQTAEAQLSDEIARHRDAGLSWVCNALAGALADDGPIPQGLNARHPDFAALAVRIGRAIGREAETVEALRAAEGDKSRFNLENDQVGAALIELVASGPFRGTAADLLEELKKIDSGLDGRMSSRRLGKRLAKLWPHLEAALGATRATDRDKFTYYSFAEFAEFKTVFPEKSLRGEKKNSLPENVLSNSANSADSTQDLFDRLGDYAEEEKVLADELPY